MAIAEMSPAFPVLALPLSILTPLPTNSLFPRLVHYWSISGLPLTPFFFSLTKSSSLIFVTCLTLSRAHFHPFSHSTTHTFVVTAISYHLYVCFQCIPNPLMTHHMHLLYSSFPHVYSWLLCYIPHSCFLCIWQSWEDIISYTSLYPPCSHFFLS